MASEIEREYLRRMQQFLREQWESPDVVSGEVIVSRQELGGIAVAVGLDEQRGWDIFKELEGLAWRGEYVPESRSEERGYTAARVEWVRPSPQP